MMELKPLTKNQKISIAMRGNKTALRHGHGSKANGYSKTYVSWQSMLSRCRYPERDAENKYVNRGIRVCARWHIFENFLADMGERPEGMTIDRFPIKDGAYEPGNCRWATPTMQARNTKKNVLDFDSAVAVALRRLKGETCKSIAVDFKISESLPREIVKGRAWKDALEAAKLLLVKK